MSPEWDPQWDADAEEPTPRPATKPGGWDSFWKETQEANDAALRKSGLDPSKPAPPAVSRTGQPLRGGLPQGGRLTCFGCNSATGERYECAQCLEIYRARATVVAADCAPAARPAGAISPPRPPDWERAVFCSESCYRANWRVPLPRAPTSRALTRAAFRVKHRGRHCETSYGPVRTDTRVHTFPGACGRGARSLAERRLTARAQLLRGAARCGMGSG